MSQIRFANRGDDGQIRKCLRENPMQGEVSLSFETEPSYFDAISVQGINPATVIGHNDEGGLIGFGTRTTKQLFVDGEERSIGYLGGLRVNQESRGRNFLSRGYEFLRENSSEDVDFYITTILEDNKLARRILESGRGQIPKYHFMDTMNTHLTRPRKFRQKGVFAGGSEIGAEEIFEFIKKEGKYKNFFPVYSADNLETTTLRGLNLDDFYAYIEHGNIQAVAGVWDQRSFKQTRVQGYSPRTNLVKPFANTFRAFHNFPRLPPMDSMLNQKYLFCPTSRGNDPEKFSKLLKHILSEESECDSIVSGFSQKDSLGSVVDSLGVVGCRSRLYTLSFEEGFKPPKLDGTNYLEVSTL